MDEGWSVTMGSMERVLGIGGYFLRVTDPVAVAAWYRDCLGVDSNDLWHQQPGATVFATSTRC